MDKWQEQATIDPPVTAGSQSPAELCSGQQRLGFGALLAWTGAGEHRQDSFFDWKASRCSEDTVVRSCARVISMGFRRPPASFLHLPPAEGQAIDYSVCDFKS